LIKHLQLRSKQIENVSHQMRDHQVMAENQHWTIVGLKSRSSETIESHPKSDNFPQIIDETRITIQMYSTIRWTVTPCPEKSAINSDGIWYHSINPDISCRLILLHRLSVRGCLPRWTIRLRCQSARFFGT
jgi:hypothetical protein